jgi:hypothetical protein
MRETLDFLNRALHLGKAVVCKTATRQKQKGEKDGTVEMLKV